ncbi:MAG: zinc metalloprotease HtpX [Chromatiales bacterium 21-64-14]|nr:MAG: zinc metalloprotease HtpX [Chromatiales bacterium 21-64-14]HQU15552.1 protease HtpX [Gammaproteobacteria bacterium]
MKRIWLFLATNLAIVILLGVTLQVLGVDELLARHGVGGHYNGLLVFAALFGIGGAFVSLALSKWTAIRTTGARVIGPPQNPAEAWLVDTVRRLAREAGIGMPAVAVFDSAEMNAFATGMRRDHALVAVSAGLLIGMERDEIEGVLGHEVSHIANGDMITLALIQGVVNTFVIFLSRVVGQVVDRVVFRVERGYGPAYLFTVIAAELVLGFLASLIVFWFSRHREFRADAGGARLAGREKMIAALLRLQSGAHHGRLPDRMAAFGISGRVGSGFARLFMTHPPLEERIAALRAGRTTET